MEVNNVEHHGQIIKHNKRKIRFHNLIFNHSPTLNSSIDHENRNPLDHRRSNLRIATQQTQMINRAPQNWLNHPGVNFNTNYYEANWVDKNGVKKMLISMLMNLGMKLQKTWSLTKD